MHRQTDAEKFKILGPAGSMHAPTQLLMPTINQPRVPWVVLSVFIIQVTSLSFLLSGFHLGCLLSFFFFLFQWLSSRLPLLSLSAFFPFRWLSSRLPLLSSFPFQRLTSLLLGGLMYFELSSGSRHTISCIVMWRLIMIALISLKLSLISRDLSKNQKRPQQESEVP